MAKEYFGMVKEVIMMENGKMGIWMGMAYYFILAIKKHMRENGERINLTVEEYVSMKIQLNFTKLLILVILTMLMIIGYSMMDSLEMICEKVLLV